MSKNLDLGSRVKPATDREMKAERTKTDRGFHLTSFRDLYNAPCSLQQSSLATYEPPGSSAVWLGIDGGKGREQCRMHLSVDQVQWLIKELQFWVEKGCFK